MVTNEVKVTKWKIFVLEEDKNGKKDLSSLNIKL